MKGGRRAGATGVVLLVTAVALVQASPAGSSDVAPPLTAPAEGRSLRLGNADPVVQPVQLPGYPQRVAAAPGGEVWAVGSSFTPSSIPGYDARLYPQEVFMHDDPAHGWVSAGPPMLDGKAQQPSEVTAIAVAPNGEGWAAGEDREETGTSTVLYHKPRGSTTWQVVEQPISTASGNQSLSRPVQALSLGTDATGNAFGFAVLQDGSVATLSGTTWSMDSTSISTGNQNGSPTIPSVVATSPTTGWAVGGAAARNLTTCESGAAPQSCLASLQNFLASTAQQQQTPDVFYRDTSGWHTVQFATPPQGGQALAVVASETATTGTAWIGGATGTQPWLVRITYSLPQGPSVSAQATSYCASGCSGGGFPEDAGAVLALDMLPGGDVFAGGGLGGSLYRGTAQGAWQMEPNTVGPVGQLAFTSPRDGWIGRLDQLYKVGVNPTSPVLGHYTASPAAPSLRDWPSAQTSRLLTVAADPDGSGAAMAGGDGVIQRLDPATGLWSPMPVPAGLGTVRAISWPSPNQAWAVAGSTILRFDGSAWRTVPVSGSLGGVALQAIAVSPTSVGGSAPGAAASAAATPPPAASNGPGVALAWGDNQTGELGNGTTGGYQAQPQQVPGLSGVVQATGNADLAEIGVYNLFTVALMQDGSVEEWGRLVPGDSGASPRQVGGLAGRHVDVVSAGGGHVLALERSSGSVWAWGYDRYDQLGDGDPLHGSTKTAMPVVFPAGTAITAIAAGADHSLAVDSHGVVWCWGSNGSEGDCAQNPTSSGSLVPQPVPGVSGAVAVAAGNGFSLALLSSGAVMAWGNNNYWQSGRTDAATSLAPWVPQAVPGITASAIAAGEDFALAIDRSSGGVVAWGRDDHSQVPGAPTPPLQATPTRLAGLAGSGVAAVAAAGAHALALLADGRTICWGQNDDGECGFAGAQNVTAPTVVPGLSGVRTLGAGQLSSLAVVAPSAPAANPGSNAGSGPAAGSPGGPLFGLAVGTGGVTARFDGRSWTVDPASTALTDHTLRTVALTRGNAVAAGDDGTVLVDDGTGWAPATIPATAQFYVQDGQQRHSVGPTLDAAAALPDGTVLLGGERGTILQRAPGAAPLAFALSGLPPLEGWIHGLAAARDQSGALRAVVVAGYDPNVDVDFGHPDDITTLTGSVLVSDGDAWRDGELADSAQDGTGGTSPDAQTSNAPRLDEVLGVALDPAGRLGWAVGQEGATWRLAVDGAPPASPMSSTASIATDPGVSFAFVANTGCFQGACRRQYGWGTRGDVVLFDALRAIDRLGREGRLDFVTLGGDLRRRTDAASSLDLGPLAQAFATVSVPVFAAPGAEDLAGGNEASWENAFAAAPAPWGSGGRRTGIRPVGWLAGDRPAGGRAATHYAFDYVRDGVPLLRVVVLDTSSLPVSGNDANQNPAEPQAAWLVSTLASARASGVPVMVVMNQLAVTTPSTGTGDASVDAALASPGGVAGILATGEPANQVVRSLLGIPVGVFAGGGGRFLKPGQSGGAMPPGEDVLHGDYSSWQLVTLGEGASTVTVRSIPVLQDVALAAPQGRSVAAGRPLAVRGLGRFPRSATLQGNGSGDQEYMPRTLALPFPRACGGAASPGGGAGCVAATVAPPDYHFRSSDDTVLAPVVEDPAHLGHPLHDASGHPVLDAKGTSGLFCAEKPGEVMVRLESGEMAAQMPVTVSAGAVGAGECGPIPAPVAPRAAQPARAPQPPPQPQKPAPRAAPLVRPHQQFNQPPEVAGAVPPPANAIPAPPGGMGQAAGQKEREEESEAAMENANMTALRHASGGPDVMVFGVSVFAMVLSGTALGLAARRRRPRAMPATLGDHSAMRRRR